MHSWLLQVDVDTGSRSSWKRKNNSFIVPDLLAFLRPRKQCFDLGVELTNIPRNDWKKGLLRLVDPNYLNLFTILNLLEVNHVLFWLLQ